MRARLGRAVHRAHRALGSVLWLLLASWFASGAVMTFGGFPHFSEGERLQQAPVLPRNGVQLPPELVGKPELRLASIEGEPRWLFDERGARRALRASPLSARSPEGSLRLSARSPEGSLRLSARSPEGSLRPWHVTPLDAARARREAQQRGGAPVAELSYLSESDQWTVPLPARLFPLWRAQLADAQASELYLCAATGEVVQHTVRSERVLAWLGAIPHWIYPTMLRRERVLWRNTVLWLAGAGLLLTTLGLLAGLDVQRRLRRKQQRTASPQMLRQPALRWHQRLGLSFGVLACCWLFSGALSFTPFAWTDTGSSYEQTLQRLQTPPSQPRVAETLALCSQRMAVRELSLVGLAGSTYLICAGADDRTLTVRQEPQLRLRSRLDDHQLRALAQRLASPHTLRSHALRDRPDHYYYASHTDPELALPFLLVEAADARQTAWYVDPRRARLLALHTRRTRLERWLYHGLHSWDMPWLVRHPWLWRGLLLSAMSAGFALSCLGGWLMGRRVWRKCRKSLRSASSRRALSKASGARQ